MKSKLGPYVINKDDLPLEWYRIAQPRVVFSMDHSREHWSAVKSVSPQTLIFGRYYLEEGEQRFDNPKANAEWFADRIMPNANMMRGVYDGWMAYNEPVITNETDAANLSAFTLRWSELMHAQGIKTLAYSFSEGSCLLELWPFLTAGVAACDYLCFHEYDAPEMWRTQGWRCLRYRKALAALPSAYRNKPVVIGETGIDGGVGGIDQPQRGWKAFGSEQHYLDSLEWYDDELQKDANVIGAAIFAATWDTGFGTFDIRDAIMIRDYIGEGQPIPPEPGPEPTPVCTLTADKAKIKPGESVTLTYRAENVSAGWLQIDDGALIPLAPAVGSRVEWPPHTTTYTLIARTAPGELHDAVTVEVLFAPPPVETPGYTIDPRIADRVTVEQGQAYRVVGVWYNGPEYIQYPNVPPGHSESRERINSKVHVMDAQGKPMPGVLVVLDWVDEADAWKTDAGGTVEFELFGEMGAYTVIVGDARVIGIGLPGHRHVQYNIQFQKT
ncbi:hypothetical protein CCP3SC15_1500007 [Gammaproteobacteria bacterium]